MDLRERVLSGVALRKESVDRNPGVGGSGPGPGVALRKESVDRNRAAHSRRPQKVLSLSARRAWIEIAEKVSKRGCRSASLSARRGLP